MSRLVPQNQLTASQREVAKILATNDIHKMTLAQIAEQVGVSERTLYRWKQDPVFIRFQNEVAEIAMEEALAEAYAKLRSLLREGKTEKTQLEAIKLVLQTQGKLKDKQEHTHEIKQQTSLQDLEKEILDMEKDLLE